MLINELREIIDILGTFKELKRSGWKNQLLEKGESDADHSWGVAFLCLLLAPENLDKGKCLKLAIIHDIQEIIAGDFVPGEINLDEKHQLEKAAIEEISVQLQRPELIKYFDEFEEQNTEEAKFVKSMDKLECVMQAAFYVKNERLTSQTLQEFVENSLDQPIQEDIKKLIRQIGIDKN